MDEPKSTQYPSGQQRPTQQRQMQQGQSRYMGQNLYRQNASYQSNTIQRPSSNYYTNTTQRQTASGQRQMGQMPPNTAQRPQQYPPQRQMMSAQRSPSGQRQSTAQRPPTGQRAPYSQQRTQMQQRPQQNRRRKRKKKKSIIGRIFKFLFITGMILCFAVGGAALGMVMGIIEGTDNINVADVVPESYTSFIYDSAGNEIDSLHGKENREYAKLETIPVNLRRAVIAIEDERFYQHNGIDLRGMARAMMTNIKSKSFEQGASTLTQQLIKNEVLTNEKKIQRKIKEQYLAVIFEKDLEKTLGSKEKAKDYILELYLNTIALNHGLNGVQSASKFYFGKEVSDLTLAESACIAGITKNPSRYSPISNPEENKKRQVTVLDKMLELGYISEGEYAQAKAEDIYSKLVGSITEEVSGEAKHSYFVDALIEQIANDLQNEKGMTKAQAYDKIYSGGLKINATVDMNMQNIMEEVYQDDSFFPSSDNTIEATYTISVMDTATEKQSHYYETKTVNSEEEAQAFAAEVKAKYEDSAHQMVAEKLSMSSSLQSAMVIMDYHNGEIKALIGGRGKKQGDTVFNRATQALRQPGSCFKILSAYAPAIDMGLLMPGSIIIDAPLKVGEKEFQNWDKKYRGATTVREGVTRSMNILAVKALMQVGYDKSYEYLQNFGFTSLVDEEERNGQIFSDKGAALALGGITDGISVLELTGAYSTIANGGLHYEPKFYTTIYDHDGNVFLENKDEPTRVLKETTAYLLTNMMEDVVVRRTYYATGTAAAIPGMTVAGKTGTTTDDKDLMFAGYTPYYCGAIWLGYDNPKTMTNSGTVHLKIWKEIMSRIHEGKEDTGFSRPDGIVSRSFCSASGMVPQSICSRDYYGNAIGSDLCSSDFGSSTEACNYHKSYSVDLSTGKLANSHCRATSVVLAVDPETGEIVNKATGADGKVDIDIHSTCTVHSASNPGFVKPKPQPKPDSDIPIGGDYPEQNSTENNNENDNNTVPDNNTTTAPTVPEPTVPEPTPPPVAEPEPEPAPVVGIDSMAPIGSE